ncbi:uncharacterized protein LOC110434132 [Sorghum bicolor]|uniref:uncharacterized protein LOC110434132 n=1 Tax=Sorghum bicolor TaxID=4558 RepID=UPI00081AB5FF|nr:uncharacterized protein LOC110434132 [Sorghum bicolor]|eukprot:XP_021313564.1 uncharacterized protein LOC110434132 [Sorghum bicolor]
MQAQVVRALTLSSRRRRRFVQDLNGEGKVAAAAKGSVLRLASTGLGGVEVRPLDFIIFLVFSFCSVLAPIILKQKVLEPGSSFSSGRGSGAAATVTKTTRAPTTMSCGEPTSVQGGIVTAMTINYGVLLGFVRSNGSKAPIRISFPVQRRCRSSHLI